jgi:hypothetical protein
MSGYDYKWASVKKGTNEVTDIEKTMFNFLLSDVKDEKDTDKKYERFLILVLFMIRIKYVIPLKYLRVAIVAQKDAGKSKEKDISINMNDYDFIAGNIPKRNQKYASAEARYMIKRRIILALKRNPNYGDIRLIEDGYCLVQPINEEKKYDDFDMENDASPFRKPFFILSFDNIPIREDIKLDRDAQPIEKVFLYVSFGFNPSEDEDEKLKEKLKVAPLLIMRDILLHRNRIMRVLEKDFSSHLMQMHAHTTGENAILKHEKTVSHTLTSDDQLPTTLWTMKEGLKNTDYEWLLFRNYINIQIAKLFNRTLLPVDNKSENEFPKLYLQEEDINKDMTFASPAEIFEDDLFNDSDRRVELCKQIIEIKVPDEVKKARLITPSFYKAKFFFNNEYLKCVLFDIFLSAAKYWNEDAGFLPRIENLECYKEWYDNNKDKINDQGYTATIKAYDQLRCKVLLLREENALVIINPVSIIDNKVLNGDGERNKRIKIQLENPYDSFDGHMSLFTISNYITGIWKKVPEATEGASKIPSFRYESFESFPPKWKKELNKLWLVGPENDSLWFVSKLPIFQEE